jgi:excisionase family DNA binding protein
MISITKNIKDKEVSTIPMKLLQERLDISYSTLYRWTRYKGLPYYKPMGSKKVFFNMKKVEDWLDKQ